MTLEKRRIKGFIEGKKIGAEVKRKTEAAILDLPEFKRLKGLSQGIEHKYDVYDHTVAVFKATKDKEMVEYLSGYNEMIPIVQLAALLHDLGKYDTLKVKKVYGVEFGSAHEHEKYSQKHARRILKELGVEKNTAKMVEFLVLNHMVLTTPANFAGENLKELLKYFEGKFGKKKAEPMLRALIALRYADIKGHHGVESEDLEEMSECLDEMMKNDFEEKED